MIRGGDQATEFPLMMVQLCLAGLWTRVPIRDG